MKVLRIIIALLSGVLIGILISESKKPKEPSSENLSLSAEPHLLSKDCPPCEVERDRHRQPSLGEGVVSELERTLEVCEIELKMLRLAHEGRPENWTEESTSCCGPSVVGKLVEQGKAECESIFWDNTLLNCDEYPCILTIEREADSDESIFKCGSFDGSFGKTSIRSICHNGDCRNIEIVIFNKSLSTETDEQRISFREKEMMEEHFDLFEQ